MAYIMPPNTAAGSLVYDTVSNTVSIADGNGSWNDLTTTITLHGDVIIDMPGKKLKLSELISRIEALEEAYMEDKLIGKK